MHADLPVQESNEVQEARAPRSRQRLQESKADSESLLSGGRRPDTRNRPPVEKTMPVKSNKIAGRNERVTVQYADGNIKKGVKFKTVEDDIKNNKCVLIED
jgi:preprotein translocase subunit SecA